MTALGQTLLIALAVRRPVDLFALRRAFSQSAPRAPLGITRARVPTGEEAFLIDLADERIVLHLAEERIPEREYSAAVRGNVLWPEAGDAMARHTAYAALAGVPARSDRRGVEAQAAALTRAAEAVATIAEALGVHWLGTETMSAPGRLVRARQELTEGRVPTDLWIGIRVVEGAETGHLGARTAGAAAFLGYELHLDPMPTPGAQEPIEILTEAAHALLSTETRVSDGDRVEANGRIFALDLRGPAHGDGPARLLPMGGDA